MVWQPLLSNCSKRKSSSIQLLTDVFRPRHNLLLDASKTLRENSLLPSHRAVKEIKISHLEIFAKNCFQANNFRKQLRMWLQRKGPELHSLTLPITFSQSNLQSRSAKQNPIYLVAPIQSHGSLLHLNHASPVAAQCCLHFKFPFRRFPCARPDGHSSPGNLNEHKRQLSTKSTHVDAPAISNVDEKYYAQFHRWVVAMGMFQY